MLQEKTEQPNRRGAVRNRESPAKYPDTNYNTPCVRSACYVYTACCGIHGAKLVRVPKYTNGLLPLEAFDATSIFSLRFLVLVQIFRCSTLPGTPLVENILIVSC